MSPALHRHVIWRSKELVAYLHPKPWTPGSALLERSAPCRPAAGVLQLDEQEFLAWMRGARAVAALLCERLGVHRCAMVTRPHKDTPAQIRVLPLHGLDADWLPYLATEEEYNPYDPGLCTSKSAPRWNDSRLAEIQTKIRAKLPSPEAPPNLTFLGDDPHHPGLFSRIVRGEEQQWRVWEDEGHVAFLTPFPNSPGLTVVIPRRPLTSDIFKLETADYEQLVLAAQKVSKLLEEALGAWGVGLIFEGFEIDYAHAKLIPLLKPPAAAAEEASSSKTSSPQFYSRYPGYVSSEDGPEAHPERLEELHNIITHKSHA
ncbi:hypothetical protein LDENG_00138540 [Lucifuga dentata]|nr:hypothetical protein LDENG_00138540 [Lucifuga dentata]